MFEIVSAALLALQQPAVVGRFNCTVVRVSDGDTIRCASGLRVRLAAIDAPEMPGSCREGRRCAPGNPHAARAYLASLVLGRSARCEAVGRTHGRVAAWCSVRGTDLSCAMVKAGHAIRYARHDRDRKLCRR